MSLFFGRDNKFKFEINMFVLTIFTSIIYYVLGIVYIVRDDVELTPLIFQLIASCLILFEFIWFIVKNVSFIKCFRNIAGSGRKIKFKLKYKNNISFKLIIIFVILLVLFFIGGAIFTIVESIRDIDIVLGFLCLFSGSIVIVLFSYYACISEALDKKQYIVIDKKTKEIVE